MSPSRLLLIALPVAAGLWALTQAPAPPRPLARWAPPGALLALEARDFAALLRDWNASPEKKIWLAGANYQFFSRSRLFYRLEGARQEFAGVAGLAPGMALVEAVAGAESLLALYGIGELEFLYITRLAEARAIESALWQSRMRFEPRSSAGRNYFVRIDPNTGRTAAFAATDGYLLLATREDALAQALALMAGQSGPALEGEAWYRDAARRSRGQGDLRLVLNMPRLAASPHFRSYWIQRNITELRQYAAAVSDLHLGPREVREERVLVRAAPAPARQPAALGELLRLAPANAGMYRAWIEGDAEVVARVLERRVLAPRPGEALRSPAAPAVSLDAPEAGSSEDLETRIDQAPAGRVEPRFAAEALRAVIGRVRPAALMVVESSREAAGGVFVGRDTAVAALGEAEWPAAECREAIREAVRGLVTSGGLGLDWVERKRGAQVYHELSGLAGTAVAVSGRRLMVASSGAALEPLLDNLQAAAPAAAGFYEVVYRHSRELAFYRRTMALIDQEGANLEREFEADEEGPGEPQFFSENLASLGEALARLDTLSVTAAEAGDAVTQTVVYRRAR